MRPTISGDQRSPKKWIMKIEIAMALARRLIGTVSMMSVLTGPVDRKMRSIPQARQLIATAVLRVTNAKITTGTAANTDQPRSSAYPAGLRLCHALAANPPRKVPNKPAPAVTAPKNVAALSTGTWWMRFRYVGPQFANPPSAKVY